MRKVYIIKQDNSILFAFSAKKKAKEQLNLIVQKFKEDGYKVTYTYKTETMELKNEKTQRWVKLSLETHEVRTNIFKI